MEITHSFFLGIIQGITEFLPISSSGHLVAIPFLFNWEPHKLVFDVALHLGTVIALFCYFWKDIINILSGTFSKRIAVRDYPSNILWQIAVASIPAAIGGILIDKYAENYFRQPIILAINFILFGVILWYIDIKSRDNLSLDDLTYKKSFAIGLAQSIALIPGVSRSGISMTAARMTGLSRENSARFSFLIGMPAMIGAFLFKVKDMTSNDFDFTFVIGVLTSAICGFLAIKYLLAYLKKSDFSIFLWYRIAIAFIIITYLLIK